MSSRYQALSLVNMIRATSVADWGVLPNDNQDHQRDHPDNPRGQGNGSAMTPGEPFPSNAEGPRTVPRASFLRCARELLPAAFTERFRAVQADDTMVSGKLQGTQGHIGPVMPVTMHEANTVSLVSEHNRAIVHREAFRC